MKALYWDKHQLTVKQAPQPERAEGEALIKVNRAGICNTDLEILRGYHDFSGIPGHEFVGTVVETDREELLGKRVVSDINCACGHCPMCRQHQAHHCLNRQTIGINQKDGAFAEYLCCPEDNLVLVPDRVENDAAVFAEPLAAALEIQEQIDCCRFQEAAVIGDGKLGLLIAMSLAGTGLHVKLIGRHPEKFALVKDYDIEFFTQEPALTFPLVVEATGNPQGLATAINITQAKGTVVLKSTYAGEFPFNPTPLVVNEICLLGSRCGPMDKAMALLNSGHIHVQRLIDSHFSIAQGVEAFKRAASKGSLKVLIDF